MGRLFFVLTQKTVLVLVASLTAAGGFLSGVTNITPSQTAIVSNAVVSPIAISTPEPSATANELATPKPGLLPKVKIVKFHVTKNSTATTSIPASSIVIKKASSPATPPPVPPLPPQPQIKMQSVTAQSFLDNTTPTFKETRDGPYEVIFTTNINGQQVSWNFGAASVGGTGSIPQFSSTFSCNPEPGVPTPEAIDQNPSFEAKTTYDCTVSLTPQAGADRRTQSKDFLFTTPAGQLIVTLASAMSDLLVDDANNAGLVFNNQDAATTTVTGLTFDVSYADLTTLNGPLVLRFLDPITDQSLLDYHLENIPQTSATNYTYGQSGIAVSFPFAIKPVTQRMLPVQILGVHKMTISGTTPMVKVTIRNVTTDRTDVKPVLRSAEIILSCAIPLTGYDPNATSGPYALGQACRN